MSFYAQLVVHWKKVCCVLVFRLWVDVFDAARPEDLFALVLDRRGGGFVGGGSDGQGGGDDRRRVVLAGVESPGGLLPRLDRRDRGLFAAADVKVLELAHRLAVGGAPQAGLLIVRLLDGVIGGLAVVVLGWLLVDMDWGRHTLVDDDRGLVVSLGGWHVDRGGGLVAGLGGAVRLLLLGRGLWPPWWLWLVCWLGWGVVRRLGWRLVRGLGWGSRGLVSGLGGSLVGWLSGSLGCVVLGWGLWCWSLGWLVSWLRCCWGLVCRWGCLDL